MVGPFPRSSLVFLGVDLNPLLGAPIENIDGVESLFVGSSSSEDDDLVVQGIVVHGAVGAVGGLVAGGLDFLPLEGG
jgi:hypothetical protein